MIWNHKALYVAVAVGAAAAISPFFVTKSLAQDVVQRTQGGAAQNRPFQGGFQPMMGGGGATMVADGDYLYILQGNRIIKLKKSDLSIVTEKELRGPMPPPEGNGGGGGGGRGGFGGGGGTGDPPIRY